MANQSDPEPHQLETDLTTLFGARWVAYRDGAAVAGLDLAARFTEAPSGRLVLSGLVLLGSAVTADQLRAIPVSALENSANLTRADVDRDKLTELGPLRRETATDPDQFSQLVAAHYVLWASRVSHPASAMAAENGVKVSTMHTWIREARLRGYLPPGRRGKAPAAPTEESDPE